MLNPVGNPDRTALHMGDLPDGPLTERQRAIVDSVRGCSALADFVAAPKHEVGRITVYTIPLGTEDAIVEKEVRRGIENARGMLDHMENVLRVHGPGAFKPQPYNVPAHGLRGETRHAVLVALLRRISAAGHRLVHAGDTEIAVAPDGGYVVAPEQTP